MVQFEDERIKFEKEEARRVVEETRRRQRQEAKKIISRFLWYLFHGMMILGTLQLSEWLSRINSVPKAQSFSKKDIFFKNTNHKNVTFDLLNNFSNSNDQCDCNPELNCGNEQKMKMIQDPDYCQHAFPALPLQIGMDSHFQLDQKLIETWNDEKSSCFSFYILIGDSSSHKHAIEFLDPQTCVEIWSNTELQENFTNFQDLLLNPVHFKETRQVILNQSADRISAEVVMKIMRIAQERCKTKSATPLVIFFSTSFGLNYLQDINQVNTDTYLRESLNKGDWFTIREIALMRKKVIHGVKGCKLYEVFSKFFSDFVSGNLGVIGNSLLDGRKKILARTKEVHQKLISFPRSKLEKLYFQWTDNERCDVILYKPYVDIKAYRVNCSPK